jgi:hypothetical protein
MVKKTVLEFFICAQQMKRSYIDKIDNRTWNDKNCFVLTFFRTKPDAIFLSKSMPKDWCRRQQTDGTRCKVKQGRNFVAGLS